MIVMKFGGASLASPASMKRVVAIVSSQVEHNPVVVVSAMGDTTDHLLGILEHASRAESYAAWKLQEEVKTYHFCMAEDLIAPERLAPIDQYIRQTFRDLHIRIAEVCEGEGSLTPELRDWVASLGEKLSSKIVAAILEQAGLSATHMDSTKLILTDDHFTSAAPRYWETYARIRWAIPSACRSSVVVLGGFIGATQDGRTTTLGRGGSDLTASIVGAALNAEEIQVWKDVDGVLTMDPRIASHGYRIRSLSFNEASELAQAGATILHPETIAPAQRLRIPVIVRNTFRPDCEGTKIGISKKVCANPVKSIVCKTNVTLVELRSPAPENALSDYIPEIERACQEKNVATLLAMSDEAIYLAVEKKTCDMELGFSLAHCTQAHIRTEQAIITLVGEQLKRCSVAARLSAFLIRRAALILPQKDGSCSVQIVVGQEELAACIDVLQRAFFADVDPAFFAPVNTAPIEHHIERNPVTHTSREQQILTMRTSGFDTSRFAFGGV